MGMSMGGGGGGGSVAAPLSLVQPSSDYAWFLQPAANYDTAWSYGGGNYGVTKGWGFWTCNSNSNFTGNRQDNFWGLMYNFTPTSTGSVWADDDEVTAGFRFEDFWLQNVAAGANVSGSPTYSDPDTTITASAAIFHGLHANALLGVSGALYRITEVVSSTQVKVRGDASAATGALIVWADYSEWHHIFGYIGQNSSGLNESGQRFVAGQLARQHPWMIWDYMTDKSTWSDSMGVIWMEARPEWDNATNGKNWTQPPYARVSGTPTYNNGGDLKTTIVFDRVVLDSSFTSLFLRVGTGGSTTVSRFAITDRVDDKTVKVSGDQRASFADGTRVSIIRSRGILELTNMYVLLGNSAGGLKIKGTDGVATGAVEIDIDNHLYLGHNTRTANCYMNVLGIIPGATASGLMFGRGASSATTDKFAFWNKTPIVQPANANQAAVAGTAGGSYTGTEQTLINAIVTLVNQIRTDLVNLGLIKGSA